MRNSFIVVLAAALCTCSQPAPPPDTRLDAPICTDARVTGRLPSEIAEASGIVASRRTPGIFWVHSDGPIPWLYAVDSTGTIKARVRTAGVKMHDWEDIAAGPCGSETCLFLGDIGDNDEIRTDRAVYRVIEPLLTDSVTGPPTRYPFHLPGRSHDAEALFVTADQRMYIVTKGRSGQLILFGFPASARPDVDSELEPIVALNRAHVMLPDLVTGAAATPDGNFVVIRSYSAFQIYRLWNRTLTPVPGGRYRVRALPEVFGEGIDIRADGSVFLVSEESADQHGPPISRVQCALPAS